MLVLSNAVVEYLAVDLVNSNYLTFHKRYSDSFIVKISNPLQMVT